MSTTKSAPVSWGIIRYAPGSAVICGDDAAGFDGWYMSRTEALAVAQSWAREFPHWIVALVAYEEGWFGDGDFSSFSKRPLTHRERALVAQARSRPLTPLA
jgi:hypothetical protein